MTSTTITHFPEGSETLSFLNGSLASTFNLIDRYIDRFLRGGDGEVPFKYNERATLGLLASGILFANEDNLALEEVASAKLKNEKAYKGREDIWFIADGRICYGEAKQTWVNASRFTETSMSRGLKTLEKEATTARTNAAEDLRSKDLHFALGILFVVPHLKERHIATAPSVFEKYRKILESSISGFAATSGVEVVWGSYFRPDLLQIENFYDSEDLGMATRPALEILIGLHHRPAES